MKPHVICHMMSSNDGRILPSRWRPRDPAVDGVFERIHDRLEGDAWLIGRVTGSEFAKRDSPYPPLDAPSPDRTNHFVRRDAEAYGVVLDAAGKIAWGRSDIGGDPIVVVTAEAVCDAHLAGLREEGVSYVFAGSEELDLAAAFGVLNAELGIERLLLEGGGGANGAFLRAGLVDEVSLVVVPAVDGSHGAPSVFDAGGPDAGRPPIGAMELIDTERLDGGAVWLRYRLTNN